VREQENVAGRELEFIVRSLLELKLQVEELRRKIGDEDHKRSAPAVGGGVSRDQWIGEIHPAQVRSGDDAAITPPTGSPTAAAIEPRDQPPPQNTVTISPGMKMADIERSAIELALKETRGNRRRAAEMLGIGERTLYRKIKEYRMPELEYAE
jgi:DNA-binding NtrC family response regulator